MQKKIVKKYAELMHQAKQATGRKEAVGLIHGCHEAVAGIQLKPTINY